MEPKECESCGRTFTTPNSRKSIKVCGVCRGRAARLRDSESIEAKARAMTAKARSRAASRKLPCEIDALWIVTRWYAQHGRCHFSGRPMTLKSGPLSVSLDRLNSSKGYTRRNTVLAALQVNLMKNDISVEDFLDWCESITNHQEAKAAEVGVNPETLKP